MGINEPGQDGTVIDIDHFAAIRDRQIWANPGDPLSLYQDVTMTPDFFGGYDHAACVVKQDRHDMGRLVALIMEVVTFANNICYQAASWYLAGRTNPITNVTIL